MSGIVIYRVDLLKRVAIAGVIGVIVLTGLSIRRHYVYLDYNFNGQVDSIRYGDKGTSIIIIKGKEFDLNDDWSKGNGASINKGDSMVKLKNSTWVKLIRPNGEMIIKH
jgi:hypothetical protein